jgi:hypothetical protein
MSRTQRARRPFGAWLAGALAVIIAGAAGIALSKTVASAVRSPEAQAPGHEPVAAAAAATAGRLRLQPDPDWTRLSEPPNVPGFAKRALAYAPHPGLSTVILASLEPVDDPTLLPAALRADARRPVAGRLAGLRAWYYRGLAAGRWQLDAAVLPTSGGVVTIACAVPGTTSEVPLGCLDALRGVSVAGAETLVPGPGIAFELRLPAVIKQLDHARIAGRTALRRGKTPRAQSQAAAGLRRAHETAAARLAPLAVDAHRAQRLVGAMQRAARAYEALERAASRRDRRAWTRASAQARHQEAALQRALAALRPPETERPDAD